MSATSSPVTNPTPKARYQLHKEIVSSHRALMQRSDLEMALDFTMLEYQRRVAQSANPDSFGAIAGHFRLLGALEFVQELKNLAESAPMPTAKPEGNLDHRA